MMNSARTSWIGPHCADGLKTRFSSAGNTSVTLSPVSSCRAGTISCANWPSSIKFFTEANGCKSSSHREFSAQMSFSHRYWLISKHSKVGRGGKDELMICPKDKRCCSGSVRSIVSSHTGRLVTPSCGGKTLDCDSGIVKGCCC